MAGAEGSTRRARVRGALAAAVFALTCVAPAAGARAAELNEYAGPIHEHTAYSDGAPRTRPSDAFASAKGFGNDFMGLTEHSDTFELPIVTNTDCLSPQVADCVLADQQEPANSFRKWDAMAEQTAAATDAGFVGIRGFEWTNDRHGHLNVLFSSNYTNAKRDGGYLDMGFFWSWFIKPVAQGGGADGLGIFNHPGRRTVGEVVPGGVLSPVDPGTEQPGSNWDDFKHVPAADGRMVGMELFNGGTDYGARGGDGDRGWYAHALDRGWHVGAIGAEDAHSPTWGTPEDPKTVMLATGLNRPALREAMAARRFYAVRRTGVTLSFTVGGELMGSRLQRAAGAPLTITAASSVPGATLELVSSGGATVATAAGELSVSRPAAASEKYYFLRVRDSAGKPVGYSSPVWVETPA